MRFIDITHPLRDGLPGFRNDPQFRAEPYSSMQRTQCRISRVTLSSHQGTHVDAMSHFLSEGMTVEAMPLSWFYGPARIVKLPKEAGEEITAADLLKHQAFLRPASRVILNTGWHREYGTERFYAEPPGLTKEAAEYLASRKLRLLGMDLPTPGPDGFAIHHALFAPEVETVLVESLANLDAVPDSFTFIGFPLHLAGLDASPIRAVALVA